jgi:small ligand-binding sensory domain FIST
MQWVNALSTHPSLETAIAEVVDRAKSALSEPADLGILFISAAFTSEFPRLMPLLKERLSLPALIGCSGGGIIGTSSLGRAKEIEGEPAISLSLAHLPNVKVQGFHFTNSELPDLDSSPETWVNLLSVSPQDHPQFVLLGDAYSFKINDFLQGLDYAYPGSAKVGGLASAGAIGGSNALFCNYQLHREGLVGVALSGEIVLDTVVAQGCRPIGPLFQVTEGERNLLLKIEEVSSTGEPACSATPLEVLQQIFQQLSDHDRALAQHSLFVGIARSEFKQHLDAGDFLIRNLVGVEPRSGVIAIGDRVRAGQRIQFHLRDAAASAEDLRQVLNRYQQQGGMQSAAHAGALMFSCLGRGEGLYGTPHFDSQLFIEHLGPLSLGGFFCNGEIGPVGGSTFLHGYTSVFGICHQP